MYLLTCSIAKVYNVWLFQLSLSTVFHFCQFHEVEEWLLGGTVRVVHRGEVNLQKDISHNV